MTGANRFAPAGAILAALLATLLPNLSAPPRGAGRPPASVSAAPAVLHLRLADLPEAAALQPAPRTHTVAVGETLWDISRAAGVTVSALAGANHISESATLHPGQALIMPGPGTAASTAPSASAAPAAATRSSVPSVHTVVSGDTLWEIARTSDVSVGALAAANRLSEDAVLRPGQVLNVPPPGTRTPARLVRLAGRTAAPVTARAVPTPAQAQSAGERLPLSWPSSGTITSRFGWRVHPIFGTREFHTGMDIATRWGSPVMVARSGIVRFTGWMSGYGRLIVVDHGSGLQTMYSHLSAMVVDSGQQVAQGQLIGRIGSTGWSTGPHLFFEVRQNDVPQDPAHYLH